MYVTYRPPVNDGEEQEEQKWYFSPDDVNNFDAEAIEGVTAMTWDEWMFNLQKGSVKARRALLWILLRHVHRGLQFRDVSITKRSLTVEFDKAEYAEMIENIEKSPDSPGANKEAVLERFHAEMDEAPEPPAESGKAPYVSVESGTPLPSHKSASTL